MQFIFRCDSSFELGSGHLMRCLTFASQLSKRGYNVHFICAPAKGSMHERITQLGFSLHLLSREDLNESEDAQECTQIILNLEPLALILDHYKLNIIWEEHFYSKYKLVVIDDLIRSHLCDVLIDTNFRVNYEGTYRDIVPPSGHLFLGPRNSFLRDEFVRLPSSEKMPMQTLVFFGGADPTNETLKFIKAIEATSSSVRFVLVVSNGHRHLEEIVKYSQADKFQIIVQPANMAELMASSQLYFGSGGTVTWERMYMGLPGVVVSIADNQTQIAKDLHAMGQQIFLGECSRVDYKNAIKLCEELLLKKKWIEETALKNQALVERVNVDPIVGALGLITLKPAELEDAEFLFDLRNDKGTREMFISKGELSFDSHVQWLRNRLLSKAPLFVVSYQGKKVGQVRIDPDFSMSVTIHSDYRGLGFATQAIRSAILLHSRQMEHAKINYVAIIKEQNLGSIRAFQKAGFVFEGRLSLNDEEFVKYVFTLEKK